MEFCRSPRPRGCQCSPPGHGGAWRGGRHAHTDGYGQQRPRYTAWRELSPSVRPDGECGRGQKLFEGDEGFLRGAGLGLESLRGALAEGSAFRVVRDQFHQYQRQLGGADDAERVLGLEEPDDVAEILGVVADDDGDAVTGGLDDVVAAPGNQAAAHKCDVSQAVDGRQFADGVEQNDAAGDRLAAPERPSPEVDTEAFEQSCHLGKALGMARGQDHDGAGMAGLNALKRLQQHAFFFLVDRAAADQDGRSAGVPEALPQTGDYRRGGGGLMSNLRLPVTSTRSSRAPMPMRRLRSSHVWARNRSTLPITLGNHQRRRWYPGKERSEMRAFTTAMRAPLRLARRRKFGQNSVSAITSSWGRRASR